MKLSYNVSKKVECSVPIVIGARSSKLSILQTEEVLRAIHYYYPNLNWIVKVCKTKGDLDLKSSLRNLDKSNFFTHELDQWLMNHKCRITIHSAKDLPDPLPEGLQVIAITEPINEEDVLVLHPDISISSLPKKLKIATSSLNRERNVLQMIPSAQIVDVRGTIDQRLEEINSKKVDGVVIAKAALMRLGYDHLNILKLKGPTTPLQGSLAILARRGDVKMQQVFHSIDSRQKKRCLYTGLNASGFLTSGSVTQCPLIQIKPLPSPSFQDLMSFLETSTFLLITSQTSVSLLLKLLKDLKIPRKLVEEQKIIAVGKSSSLSLQKEGIYCSYIAQEESQEGLIKLIERIPRDPNEKIFYPKSRRARPLLENYLKQSKILFQTLDLYDTISVKLKKKPCLENFDQVVLTSPSGVNSFFENFKEVPGNLEFICKGPVTAERLQQVLNLSVV